MLEEDIGACRAGRLQVDEGANLVGPLAIVHEAMRGREYRLLAAIQQQHQGCLQLYAWVGHNHARHLQRRPHAGSAVRCTFKDTQRLLNGQVAPFTSHLTADRYVMAAMSMVSML